MVCFDPHADPKPGWIKAPTADGLVMDSHGDRIFGRYLSPALYSVDERRPVVILCHGFPGQEQNIDLAQALRRAGFFVIYFWYRGVWGSHGNYSFTHIIEDIHTVVDYVRSGRTGLPIDTDRIYLFGHSMGGFAALNALATGLKVNRAILMAPCNLCYRYFYDKPALASLVSAKDRGYFRLTHYTALEDDLEENAQRWFFPNLIDRLPAHIPYHFICGMQDTVCPAEQHVKPLLTAMEARGFDVTYQEWDDGHSFHATRLYLADVITGLLKDNE